MSFEPGQGRREINVTTETEPSPLERWKWVKSHLPILGLFRRAPASQAGVLLIGGDQERDNVLEPRF